MATETDTTNIDARRLVHRLPDDVLLHGGIVFSILLMASPLLLAVIMSTQSTTEVYQVTNLGLGSKGLSNYSDALVNYDFSTYMLNSFVMSVIVVVGKVTLSLFAALALVYYRFPYERAVFMFILLTLLLPVPVRIVPLFQLMADLGWTNSLLALTGPYIASATAVFLFRQQFMGISASLVEVARLDGVGPLTFLFRVLIPMSRGMIAGVCVITFIYTWNQFLWPLVVVTDKSSQVVQVGIRYLQGSAQAGLTQWGLIMAGAVLALLPPLVVLVVLHRPLLRTLTIQQK
ncbi:carbohydrate ABC transporter permease [Haloferax sp. Atlit-10N]|uniref:Sn-glycerol-3-phosphate transport system permease n=1 Tax=Haloferax prahovense (strain DSM 18310 / JCM 13924 / TL6) TaxID=1227461 RepID=M0FXZ0_HALPT|nr:MULTISPECIES: carbohydrate ABC transporter permease [Haloferax]ELZ63454.1 sn-glycerol-3-phosphate transport system permease [Haloferax prahovense DSM 18310]RDZ39694.1 carbohydrate ABC transporter permease [Haloferax sp. Atlit-19N]RDZ39884.1 carbohydrate ABC transporter permease [Haloferax sp. Atlit-16N]RDZ51189.1 carbohydrate ABC transporter permease [Haloferax sp. Atlit-4N]RDZ56590.1 carbohydrate ABC transporter permease [Haloferax sp. Atlit-10N]